MERSGMAERCRIVGRQMSDNKRSITVFPTAELANAAIDLFLSEAGALRAKHGIASLYLGLSVHYFADDGEQTRAMTAGGCGEPESHESIAAYALGAVQADRRQRINKLISGGQR